MHTEIEEPFNDIRFECCLYAIEGELFQENDVYPDFEDESTRDTRFCNKI